MAKLSDDFVTEHGMYFVLYCFNSSILLHEVQTENVVIFVLVVTAITHSFIKTMSVGSSSRQIYLQT